MQGMDSFEKKGLNYTKKRTFEPINKKLEKMEKLE